MMIRLPATVGLGEICDIYIIIGELCHSFHIFYNWDIQRLDWYSSCFRVISGDYIGLFNPYSRYAENAGIESNIGVYMSFSVILKYQLTFLVYRNHWFWSCSNCFTCMEYCHCHIVFTFQNQEFKSFPVEQTIGKKNSYGNNISIFLPVYWYQNYHKVSILMFNIAYGNQVYMVYYTWLQVLVLLQNVIKEDMT